MSFDVLVVIVTAKLNLESQRGDDTLLAQVMRTEPRQHVIGMSDTIFGQAWLRYTL
jgi:hypothetical protein